MEQYIIYLGYAVLVLITLKVFRQWIAFLLAGIGIGLMLLGAIFHADTVVEMGSMLGSGVEKIKKLPS